LKYTPSSGYSSQVRGWLVINGIRHELAQVGPDFCITRQPIDTYLSSLAELIVEVDGDQQVVPIQTINEQSDSIKLIKFARA
jgi:hypothetical protein